MRDRLLRGLVRLVLSRPRTVVLSVLLLATAAGLVLPGLRVEAGHSSLVDAQDPHQKRFRAFLSRFGSPNLLIAVVQGGSAHLRRKLVDRLLEQLPRHPVPRTTSHSHNLRAGRLPHSAHCTTNAPPNSPACVRDTVGRIDLDQIKSRALLYLPLPQLRALVTSLESDGLGLRKILAIQQLPQLFSAVAEEIERRSETTGPLSTRAREEAGTVLDVFQRFLRLMQQQLQGTRPPGVSLEEALFSQSVRDGVDSRGYLSSTDGKLQLCLIRPVNDSDEPQVVVPFVGYVEHHGRRALKQLGQACASGKTACPDGPLSLKLTGLPAIIADETRIVTRDVAVTSLVAMIGILALFIFGFRSVRQSLLGLTPLIIGLILTMAFVRLAFGALNLVTAAFIATLLGLGIDFAVHLLSRYNEIRRQGAEIEPAVERAIMGASPGILTGALTTSGAFVALAVNQFQAFSQLGIITGVGLMLVLTTTLTLMPAMLVIPRLRWLQGKLAAPRPPRSTLDLPALVVRRSWLFVVLGLGLAAFMLYKGREVPWSYDYIKLMPQSLTSVSALKELADRTDYSAGVAAVEATSLEQTRRMTAALQKKRSIRRADSITSYIPEQQEQKLALLQRLRPTLDAAPTRPTPTEVDLPALRQAVTTLKDGLEDAAFEARRGGATAEAELLGKPVAGLVQLLRALNQVPAAEAAPRLTRFQGELIAGLNQGIAILRQNVEATAITVQNLLHGLPVGLRDRLYHAPNHFAIYAYPSASVGDKVFLQRLVQDIREVSPDATGFPVTHWESSRSIEKGFRDAAIAASLALVLLLLLDFRSLRYTLLAVAPLGIGIAWMWGSMSLMGMEYTYVNIIAFPLIIGIGVASGVHILHRYRQEGTGDVALVIRFTGMAVFLSATTTMVGFGSLALAQHQGAANLGVLLLVGVGSCLLAATLFLPALVYLLRRYIRP